MHVQRAATGSEADSWRWEPRLHGLVSNDFVPSFDEMLAWPGATQLEAPQHMSTWSRVAWLLGLEKADLRGFLMAISDPIDPGLSEEDRKAALTEAGKRALRAGFGKSPAELDQAWRKWLLKKYPKR